MNDQNNPLESSTSTTPDLVAPVNEAPPVAPKKPRNWLVIGLISALFLLLLILLPVAYAIGRMSAVTDLSKNISEGPSSTSSTDTENIDEIEDATEELEEYSGWNTYENTVYGYSFKYPSDWQVKRNIVQEPADWVSINPPSGASSESGDVLAIYTYFDGTGCPATKTKEFTIGGYTVKGTACVEDDVYKVGMKHSKTVSQSGGVILARTAPDAIGIQIDMGRGEKETIQQILASVTGLKP